MFAAHAAGTGGAVAGRALSLGGAEPSGEVAEIVEAFGGAASAGVAFVGVTDGVPAVRWTPLVAQTFTDPPRISWTYATWSFATTVPFVPSCARSFATELAPVTVASSVETLPIGICAQAFAWADDRTIPAVNPA